MAKSPKTAPTPPPALDPRPGRNPGYAEPLRRTATARRQRCQTTRSAQAAGSRCRRVARKGPGSFSFGVRRPAACLHPYEASEQRLDMRLEPATPPMHALGRGSSGFLRSRPWVSFPQPAPRRRSAVIAYPSRERRTPRAASTADRPRHVHCGDSSTTDSLQAPPPSGPAPD